MKPPNHLSNSQVVSIIVPLATQHKTWHPRRRHLFGMAHYTSGRSGFQTTTTTTTFPAPSPVAAFVLHQTTGRNGFDDNNKKDSSATSSTESREHLSKTSKDRLVHAGIRCDNCMQDPIVGVRYRCSVCADF